MCTSHIVCDGSLLHKLCAGTPLPPCMPLQTRLSCMMRAVNRKLLTADRFLFFFYTAGLLPLWPAFSNIK